MKFVFDSQEKVSLVQGVASGTVGRRQFLRTAAMLGITAATAGAVLTACDNGTKGGSDKKNAYKAGSATLQVELGAEDTKVPYGAGYIGPKARELKKFGDGKTEFSVLTRTFAGQNMKTNKFSVWLEEKTGVKVNYQVVPIGEEGTPKVNNILAGGDLPDAMMLGPAWMGGFSRSQIYIYGQQGLFAPVGKLIDEFAPELLEVFKNVPKLRDDFTAPDGEMYAFPAVNQCYHCRSSEVRMWVNSTWLKRAGLKAPTTLDEFTAMLRAFKEKNPSGLASSVPMSASKAGEGSSFIGYIMQSFGYLPASNVSREGNKLIYAPTQDFYRDGLRYMAGLAKEGLLDKRSFTQTGDELKRQVMNPAGALVGLVQGGSQGSYADVEASNPKARYREYEVIAPVKNGSIGAVCPWDYSAGGVVGLIITKNCKDPETMIRWADAQMNLEVCRSMPSGPLGVGFEWAKKGQLGINGKQATFSRVAAGQDEKNLGWYEWGPYNYQNDVRLSESVDPASGSVEPALYEAGKLYEPFAVAEEKFFTAPFFDESQAAQVGEWETNLGTYLSQSNAKFILGELDINDDKVWDNHKKKFQQLGQDQYLQLLTDTSAK